MLLLRFEGWLGSNGIKGCGWEELPRKHAQRMQRPRAGEDRVSEELSGASGAGTVRCWGGEHGGLERWAGLANRACGLGEGVGFLLKATGNLYMHVCRSIIHNSPKVETTLVR